MFDRLRRQWLARPLHRWAQRSLPALSATEAEAMAAGDTWWEAELFSGAPDWQRLRDMAPPQLSLEEQAFLDGPVDALCRALDDWQISGVEMDLPGEVWDMLRRGRFFGMIIPREHGGLGFSAYAHSEVVKRISTRSVAAAVTVMVPNSLGPGELLLQFGTQAQKARWLPRLASGEEIPCFALTSDAAGSDASAMVDTGIVCRRRIDGESVLGVSLTFAKRYITLAPVATVLGLAFRLHDPQRLLSDQEDRGITVALVPTDTPGVVKGRRHLPAMQAFMNGPVSGADVFVPLDAILGGEARIGQGWPMLMSALAAGRGISLPSLATAAACTAARTSGAYARVREQFGVPIGRFEGVKEKLGRLAGNAYLLEAARRFTCAGIDQGHHPAIVSAIMKLHATERMRAAVNDAMDIHGGKAIIDGPSNWLGNIYRSVPVAITVEGANIVTRSLIVFGQGASRDHPYLAREMAALQGQGEDAVAAFDAVVWKHAGHIVANLARALAAGWSGGAVATGSRVKGPIKRYYKQMSRYCAALATATEAALLAIGGKLKRKEALSARYGDVLAELYLLSAVLKRWEDEGRREEDLPLVEWACESGFRRIEDRFASIFAEFPVRGLDALLRVGTMPFRSHARGPSDACLFACADMLLASGKQRDRITCGVHPGGPDTPVARLDAAMLLVERTQPLRDRQRHDAAALLGEKDLMALEEARRAVAAVIAVDDFDPDAIHGVVPPGPRAGLLRKNAGKPHIAPV